jgi:hypothetical protein
MSEISFTSFTKEKVSRSVAEKLDTMKRMLEHTERRMVMNLLRDSILDPVVVMETPEMTLVGMVPEERLDDPSFIGKVAQEVGAYCSVFGVLGYYAEFKTDNPVEVERHEELAQEFSCIAAYPPEYRREGMMLYISYYAEPLYLNGKASDMVVYDVRRDEEGKVLAVVKKMMPVSEDSVLKGSVIDGMKKRLGGENSMLN